MKKIVFALLAILEIVNISLAQESNVRTGGIESLSMSGDTIFSESIINSDYSINEIIGFIEKTLTIEQFNIDATIPYTSIKEVLETKCTEGSITDAKERIKRLNQKWYDSLPSSYTEKIKALKKRFMFVQEVVGRVSPQNQTEDFCKQKYLLYSIREITQEYHNTLTGKKKFITFIQATDGLNEKNMSTSRRIDVLLQRIMEEFQLRGILEEKDLKRLDEKIQINYKSSCGPVNGSFHVVKNNDANIAIFKNIEINIPICNGNFPSRLEEQIKKILAHEIGHYIYFFRDNNTEIFSDICWKNEKSICEEDDFITNYAEEKIEEDYAESFMSRFINLKKNNSSDDGEYEHNSALSKRQRKMVYFNGLFKKI